MGNTTGFSPDFFSGTADLHSPHFSPVQDLRSCNGWTVFFSWYRLCRFHTRSKYVMKADTGDTKL